jgi:hypothetical protein
VVVKLWLDDVRPPPAGWTWVTTVEAAKHLLATVEVTEASLDHDLGICADCLARNAPGVATLHCDHVPDGYALVRWLVRTGHWPATKPRVHSQNPHGAARMRDVIERYWPERERDAR